MKKSIPAANPDAYVAALVGWRRECVEHLRAAVRKSLALEEVVKWGHLVYLSNGSVLLIRAEDFYQRRGYEPYGIVPDYPVGHTRWLLMKALPRQHAAR